MHRFNYCERLSPYFWAEPINAISNIFFLVAAFFAYRYLKSRVNEKEVYVFSMTLIVLLICIGMGSFSWHTLANRPSELADVIPITLFIYVYLVAFLRVILKKGYGTIFMSLSVFTVINYFFNNYIDADTFNGSLSYAPALSFLFILAYLIREEEHIKMFIRIIFVFCISLLFRSIDFVMCEYISFGTHFLWHVLNAIVLYLLIKFLILTSKKVLL